MDISSNTSALQTLAPRPQTLPIAEEIGAPASQPERPAESPDQSPPPARTETQPQAAEQTTDLNELLLRNSANQEEEQALREEPQDRETQRNQLEDRFNALTNDAPTPNIDIST